MKIKEDKGQRDGGWLSLAGRLLSSIFICLLLSSSISLLSCSEDSEEEGEFDNWQEKNETVLSQWVSNSSYRKILTYSKTDGVATQTKPSDYIYVEVLEQGSGSTTPLFTDTVRVAYRGHYIPTESYADGLVFEQTYIDDFNWQTAGVSIFVTSGVVDGFGTALMNMHVGDRWRVRIPYALAYGENPPSTVSVPAYSNLVFEIAMYDFWHPGEYRPTFKTRK